MTGFLRNFREEAVITDWRILEAKKGQLVKNHPSIG